MGYWNDPQKTAERFRPLPGRETGIMVPELAVFSGDTVRRDADGFLYFIGRRDEMIKSKVNFSYQTVTASRSVDSVVHADTVEAVNWRCPLRANPKPRIASEGVDQKQIYARTG